MPKILHSKQKSCLSSVMFVSQYCAVLRTSHKESCFNIIWSQCHAPIEAVSLLHVENMSGLDYRGCSMTLPMRCYFLTHTRSLSELPFELLRRFRRIWVLSPVFEQQVTATSS